MHNIKIKKIIINRKWNKNKKKVSPAIRLYRLQSIEDYNKNYSLYMVINEKNPLKDKKEVSIVKNSEITTSLDHLEIYPLYIKKS